MEKPASSIPAAAARDHKRPRTARRSATRYPSRQARARSRGRASLSAPSRLARPTYELVGPPHPFFVLLMMIELALPLVFVLLWLGGGRPADCTASGGNDPTNGSER